MKKSKIIMCFVVLIGLFISPLFFGCKKEVKVNLTSPEDVAYQINEDTGRELLVTQENKFASSYIFGISTTDYDEENLDKFYKYETDKNYLDVTNIFKNAKTYYFYVQYKGTGKYVSSGISPIRFQSITQKLDTPFLSLANGILSWYKIDNATSYSVYAVVNNRNEFIATTSSTEYDITSYIETKINQGLSTELKFFVYCNSADNYLRSGDSNQVSYTAHLYLKTPTNLAISASTPKRLSWTVAKNASTYTVNINNNTNVIVNSSNSTTQNGKVYFNVSEYYEMFGLGEYEFKVKANANGSFVESSYSSVVTDTYTKQLATPQNVRCIDNYGQVEITWELVENARTYILEFSDVKNGYTLKRYNPNGSGVQGTIIHNSVTLSYSELGITNINTLNSSNFVVRVKAEGYNYYTDSNYSSSKTVVSKNQVLLTPSISNDSLGDRIYWNDIDGAQKYEVLIEFENVTNQYNTFETYFDYAEYVLNAGKYTFKVKAIASNVAYNSSYSNQIEKEVTQQLATPQLNSVTVNDRYFVFDFDCDSKVSTNSLYANNTLIDGEFSKNNPKILIDSVANLAQNNLITFYIKSNGYNYWTDSEVSNDKSISIKLQTPNISLNGNVLSWNNVENATSYTLFLDDYAVDLNSTNNQVNLEDYVEVNTARQLIVQATNQYLINSELSQKVIYNRAEKVINNHTNRFFYYGQTYDYYITDETEFFDLIEYSFYNLKSDITCYVDYDTTTSIYDKVKELVKGITGTHNYTYQILKNSSRATGETQISFDHKSMSAPPTYTSTYTQYEGGMVYSGQGTRDQNHIFASDNYIVSQDVYTTDGLLSAIQNRAKPNFVTQNSMAETIYNKAKSILIEICDDDMTDYQKALAIHDYLVTNISYDTYGLQTVSINNYLGYFHFIESALLYNLAVCDGYAKSFALLCEMEEIKCIVVDGSTDKTNKESTGHAWNKICLDYDNNGTKEWFIVDCTYDDVKNNNVEHLMHEYFMIPDSYLAQRCEDRNYPSTSLDTEAFYSVYRFDGTVNLTIDSIIKLSALKSYLNTHQDAKIEFIVTSNLYSALGSYISKAFVYSYDSTYRICFTN